LQVLGVFLLSLPLATFAADNRSSATSSLFQLTPFAGYRFGGTFEDEETNQEYDLDDSPSYGVILNFPSRGNTEWEIYYSKQATSLDNAGFIASDTELDVDVEYLQAGGTYLFEQTAQALPYFVATAGATKISPDGPGAKSDTFFSFGVGGGWKFFPASRIGLRLDGRFLGTFVDSNSKIFCGSGPAGGTCAISTVGKLLYQFELQAGVIFRF
jgi:opacity protein-like surface antigen